MKIKMHLLSDTIFGSGMSVPGGEDISILHDAQGFPYYKGSSLKGIFREEMRRLLLLQGISPEDTEKQITVLLGIPGDDGDDDEKLFFSELTIPEPVKKAVRAEIGDSPEKILDAFTSLRTFTALEEGGTVKKESLRTARCASKGAWYFGEIRCPAESEKLVREVLAWIKWIGSMRNRGFGSVRISIQED